MTVAELNQRMSVEELREWIAIDAVDPLPDRRADWHLAALAALNLNLHAKRDKGGAWSADEMRPFAKSWDPPPDHSEQAESDRRAAVARTILDNFRVWKAGRAT